jgi:hypothetical protein
VDLLGDASAHAHKGLPLCVFGPVVQIRSDNIHGNNQD